MKVIIATCTQGTEFSLCQDHNAATLAALDTPSNRGALPLPNKQLRQLRDVDRQPPHLLVGDARPRSISPAPPHLGDVRSGGKRI